MGFITKLFGGGGGSQIIMVPAAPAPPTRETVQAAARGPSLGPSGRASNILADGAATSVEGGRLRRKTLLRG